MILVDRIGIEIEEMEYSGWLFDILLIDLH